MIFNPKPNPTPNPMPNHNPKPITNNDVENMSRSISWTKILNKI